MHTEKKFHWVTLEEYIISKSKYILPRTLPFSENINTFLHKVLTGNHSHLLLGKCNVGKSHLCHFISYVILTHTTESIDWFDSSRQFQPHRKLNIKFLDRINYYKVDYLSGLPSTKPRGSIAIYDCLAIMNQSNPSLILNMIEKCAAHYKTSLITICSDRIRNIPVYYFNSWSQILKKSNIIQIRNIFDPRYRGRVSNMPSLRYVLKDNVALIEEV